MSKPIETLESADQQAAYGGLVRMLTGHWTVQAIYVFAKLGVADRLYQGAKSGDDLAAELGVDAGSLFRILRGLAAVGVLREHDERTFELTATGDLLRTEAAYSLRDLAIMSGEEQYIGWGKLLESVQSGSSAFEEAHGAGLFKYLSEHPSAAATFEGAMVGLSRALGESLAKRFDFGPFRDIVDLGGGRGIFLSRILQEHPHLHGIVFDVPHVAANAGAFIGKHGLADRCVAIGGDFFSDGVPEDGDLYVFCQTLFNWSDERVLVLLKACRRQMPEGGALLIVEQMLGKASSPFAAMMDLQMMAMPGGRVRTVAEYHALLSDGGFRTTDQLDLTPLSATVLVAGPAS